MKFAVKKAGESSSNIIIKGEPGSGKTVLAGEWFDVETTVVASTDNNALTGRMCFKIEDWDDAIDFVNFCVNGAKDNKTLAKVHSNMKTVQIDVLDDFVRFATEKAMKQLGMTRRSDAAGGYGKLTLDTLQLMQKEILHPLLVVCEHLDVVLIMHTAEDKNGNEVPTFGGYNVDAVALYNWIVGRCNKVVQCVHSGNEYYHEVEMERKQIEKNEE